MIKNLSAAMQTYPPDVKDGDAFVAKVVAVAGYDNDWALYIGPTEWTDEEVATRGDKLDEAEVPLAYVMRLRRYRR